MRPASTLTKCQVTLLFIILDPVLLSKNPFHHNYSKLRFFKGCVYHTKAQYVVHIGRLFLPTPSPPTASLTHPYYYGAIIIHNLRPPASELCQSNFSCLSKMPVLHIRTYQYEFRFVTIVV